MIMHRPGEWVSSPALVRLVMSAPQALEQRRGVSVTQTANCKYFTKPVDLRHRITCHHDTLEDAEEQEAIRKDRVDSDATEGAITLRAPGGTQHDLNTTERALERRRQNTASPAPPNGFHLGSHRASHDWDRPSNLVDVRFHTLA